jgi:hypothetical protein
LNGKLVGFKNDYIIFFIATLSNPERGVGVEGLGMGLKFNMRILSTEVVDGEDPYVFVYRKAIYQFNMGNILHK